MKGYKRSHTKRVPRLPFFTRYLSSFLTPPIVYSTECNRNCTLGRTEFDEIDNLSRALPLTCPK
jgi:hypothetical protein